MAPMMPESLAIGRAGECPSLRAPRQHGVNIGVHAVMGPKPFALTGVAGKQIDLLIDNTTNVNDHMG